MLRLHFCVWTDAASPWISGDAWRACEVPGARVAPTSCSPASICCWPVDLSLTTDLTALLHAVGGRSGAAARLVRVLDPDRHRALARRARRRALRAVDQAGVRARRARRGARLRADRRSHRRAVRDSPPIARRHRVRPLAHEVPKGRTERPRIRSQADRAPAGLREAGEVRSVDAAVGDRARRPRSCAASSSCITTRA